jgi:hypothetical protein
MKMNTPFDALPDSDSNIVYIRPVLVADLPAAIRDQADGLETLYSVHRTDGARLALVADKSLAFALARQHDLAPVSVH